MAQEEFGRFGELAALKAAAIFLDFAPNCSGNAGYSVTGARLMFSTKPYTVASRVPIDSPFWNVRKRASKRRR